MSYLDHLPAVFRDDPFLGRFLVAFEAVLSGVDGLPPDVDETEGLESVAGRIAGFLDPATTPPEFLPWLASWVALSLRADWDEQTKRGFIARIVQLYKLRGTRAGMAELLGVYTGHPVVVYDTFDEPAHFFQVRLTLPQADPELLRRAEQTARQIIDQEKPAHTFYALEVSTPTMRLVSLARQERERTDTWEPPLLILGDNTLLGSENTEA
jgi:phage tail-like protein